MVDFSFPLFSVTLATLLAYVPHFARVVLVTRAGKYDNARPRAHDEQHASIAEGSRGLVQRLAACHTNQLEMLGVYAAGVVANVAVGENDTTLIIFTALYVGLRALYVVVYALPQVAGGYLRTFTFVGCMTMMFLIWGKAAF